MERVVRDDPLDIVIRWGGILTLLVCLAGVGYLYYFIKCIDGCGPYHNSASAADLDGDGDLDVVLSNLRHESETGFWAGPTLWINQGGGQFTPSRVDFGGPYTTAGDVDGDGDADLLRLEYGEAPLQIHLNYGEQDSLRSDFCVWYGIYPKAGLSYPGNHGSILLGDLNNDGWLDAFVGGCCGVLLKENGKETYRSSLSWVWINIPDENGLPKGKAVSLASLGDLPMRPALGDLDGDGDLDVFAAIQPPKKGGSYVSADRVLLNDGNGNFHDAGQRLGETGSTAVALGDLDSDGDLDALVGNTAGAVVWTNQGGAQGGQASIFADSGQRISGNPSEAVFLADLDGDGDLDALVAGKSQAAIWWNDGQAGFRNSGQRLRFTERHALVVDDFNGDGYLDVFSAAYDLEFHLWLNRGDGSMQEGN